MERKTMTTLGELRIGDSFTFLKRADVWNVTARADKKGKVAINQLDDNKKPLLKYDELKKASTEVLFLRHTIPVPGEECFICDLNEGDIFYKPDDIIHDFEMVKRGHFFYEVRRLDQMASIRAGKMAVVIFVRKNDEHEKLINTLPHKKNCACLLCAPHMYRTKGGQS
jgi:hypothetical protein